MVTITYKQNEYPTKAQNTLYIGKDNLKYCELKSINFINTFQENRRNIRAEVHTQQISLFWDRADQLLPLLDK